MVSPSPSPLPVAMRAFLFVPWRPLMSTETQVQQSLAELPLWLLLLIGLAGLVGEMRQADKAGLVAGELVKRVVVRFGSSALFGMATLMFVYWLKQDYMLAGALGIAAGLLGADLAGALYSRYLAKRLGLGDVPPVAHND
jgi:hypothetical protein